MPIGLSVALFGALGALTRYGVDLLIEHDLLQSRLALLNAAVSVGAGIAGIYLGPFLIRR